MRRRTALLAAAALLPLAAPALHAQQTLLPLSAEVRLDAGIPLGDTRDEVKTGVGFSGDIALRLTPNFAVYGGYSRFNFDTKPALVGGAEEVRDDGWEVGGKAYLGSGGGVTMPYAQLGALFHGGDTGLEAGLGWSYPVGGALSVTPSVRYRTLSGFDYLAAGVGLELRL